MHSRRKFLIQGSLATTAVLALKPFTAIARAASPFTGLSGNNGKLVFLHTSNLNPQGDYKVIQLIKSITNNNANTILLNAGKDEQYEASQLTYDVIFNNDHGLSVITDDYKIINKGAIRAGIIMARPGDSDVIQKMNTLSAYLKKEKGCSVVVCLSQLGYKNIKTPDDITLAKKSTDLDIIIGGDSKNFHKHPVIALNSINGEVIIHSAAGHPTGFGKIVIDFDDQGRKKLISFADQSLKNTTPNRAMPAA